MTPVHVNGLAPYEVVHRQMAEIVRLRANGELEDDVLLMLEHEPTITVGRGRDGEAGLLLPNAPVHRVERGGEATWHGPGQLVAYPILRLEGPWRDLHRVLRSLESAVIDTLRDAGLTAGRDARNTGVWLPAADGPPRKVCSIGIAARRWVTWHGLALNVSPELSGFASIRPCGFEVTSITRLIDHLDPCPPLQDWRLPLATHIARITERQLGAIRLADPGHIVAAVTSPTAGD